MSIKHGKYNMEPEKKHWILVINTSSLEKNNFTEKDWTGIH